ncbi:MAG TPA: translation initiation factor [Pirellulaceae bacterium]|nr:translation initiation factor [Pirellulaceae bacterium]
MRLFEGTQFDIPPRCERCGKLVAECRCPPEAAPRVPPEQQTVQIAVEKRKKGKVVTVVRGLANDGALPELLTKLKNACGAGGSEDAGVLEIQGEHVERMRTLLKQWGYRVK